MTHSARLLAVLLVVCLVAAGRAAAQTPAAPSPLQPANGASVQVPLTISWSSTLNPSETSGGHNWQVSRSASFSPLVLADSTSPATTQDVVSGLTPGTYFWRVQAVNAGGQSAWSQARSFTVTGAGPGTPGTPVLAPTRGYSTFHPWEFIHFDWSAVPDAVTYRLEVSNDPNFPWGSGYRDVLERQHPDQQRRVRSYLDWQLVRPRVRGGRRQSAGGHSQPALERDPVLRLL